MTGSRPAPHDFSVNAGPYRLCARCAKPDLTAVRRTACKPLPAEEIEPKLRRLLAMAKKFRGTPTATGRPIVGRPPARRKLGQS